MIQRTANFVTVIEVIQGMGLEPTNDLDWAVGRMMQEWYENLTGHPPIKDNRQKTNGTGSHCFALYPECFRLKIKSFILLHRMESARQPDLFAKAAL